MESESHEKNNLIHIQTNFYFQQINNKINAETDIATSFLIDVLVLIHLRRCIKS